MNHISVIAAILTLLSGIGIFLIACGMMSSNLEAAGSDRLRKLFARTSKSRLLGVGIGAVGTAAIQSSGATTVMVIGFVNAGIMTLSQAAAIIYGANIGTTITGQIVALGVLGTGALSATVVFSSFAGIGAFLTVFSKKDRLKTTGGIVAGFGMLFVGLSMMSGSMEHFAQLEAVRYFLAGINNAFLLVLAGTLLTAVVQSSSVITSIAILMVTTGLITLDQGIYLTMGSNIGSCIVALIAGMTSGKNAKRTALIHLLFNVSGVALILLLSLLLRKITAGSLSPGVLFETLFPSAPQTQLAMFHTAFNLFTVFLVLPLTDRLIRLVTRLVPDDDAPKAPDPETPRLSCIDEKMLSTPPIAVAQLKNEILRMADLAMRNFSLSLHIVCTLDFSESARFAAREKELNFLNRELVRFLVRLSNLKLSGADHAYLSTAFHTVSDLERIGDYAENIVEYADSLRSANEAFSDKAVKEIDALKKEVENLYYHVMKAYTDRDPGELAIADGIEEIVDEMTDEMKQNHIHRLNEGVCTPSVGAQYLSLSSNVERVADHLINVAKSIRNL